MRRTYRTLNDCEMQHNAEVGLFTRPSNFSHFYFSMEDVLDILWQKILVCIHYFVKFLDTVFSPLNAFGPAVAILVIVLLTVVCTKYFSKHYKTKRYGKLENDFQYWLNLRKEALDCDDMEKGKAIAKNIDQAQLNRVYYDYFFEGLLSSILTKYIPIFIMLAYVNEAFKPERLLHHFGKEYIFQFTSADGKVIFIGSVFWFVLSIVSVYLAWFIIEKMYAKYLKQN